VAARIRSVRNGKQTNKQTNKQQKGCTVGVQPEKNATVKKIQKSVTWRGLAGEAAIYFTSQLSRTLG
jgi:hypothetical protein